MATYWLTFRIENETVGRRTYDDRRTGLYKAIEMVSTRWWTEPTSFVLFDSAEAIDDIANLCKEAVSETYDVVLMRQIDSKSARIIGNTVDADIFEMMPYLTVV